MVEEMIKNLVESAKTEHIRNEIRYFLNGSVEKIVNIHKRDLHYINNLEMNKFMEKDDRRGNGKANLNLGIENTRFGVTVNAGYDTKGENIRGGIGFKAIY